MVNLDDCRGGLCFSYLHNQPEEENVKKDERGLLHRFGVLYDSDDNCADAFFAAYYRVVKGDISFNRVV